MLIIFIWLENITKGFLTSPGHNFACFINNLLQVILFYLLIYFHD